MQEREREKDRKEKRGKEREREEGEVEKGVGIRRLQCQENKSPYQTSRINESEMLCRECHA